MYQHIIQTNSTERKTHVDRSTVFKHVQHHSPLSLEAGGKWHMITYVNIYMYGNYKIYKYLFHYYNSCYTPVTPLELHKVQGSITPLCAQYTMKEWNKKSGIKPLLIPKSTKWYLRSTQPLGPLYSCSAASWWNTLFHGLFWSASPYWTLPITPPALAPYLLFLCLVSL